jgi:DNA-binding CsgD family transcriptional regulator
MRGHLSEGRAALSRALAIDEAVDDAVRGAAVYNLGNLSLDLNEFAEARALFEESHAIHRQLGDRDGIASALNGLGLVARELGDFARARDLHRQALVLWQEINDERGVAAAEHSLGRVAAAEGEYERAREHYEHALAVRRAIGDKNGVAYSLWVLGNVALHVHEHYVAEAHYQESITIFRELGDRQGEAYILHGLARLAAQFGDDITALRLFRDVIELRQSLGERNEMVESIESIAAIIMKRGHLEQGVQLLGAAAALREVTALAPTTAERQEREQMLALAQRTLPTAIFQDAWAVGRALSLEQATTKALETTEETSLRLRPATPFNLTRRELDVLALLCQHLTDPEIARALYISNKTASNHVANILGKLSVSSRREAITLASRHGLLSPT